MAVSDAEGDGAGRLQRLAGFLADPATHGVAADAMSGPIETHGAIVVLAGDRACKIKKPVALPYMDLSTLDRRERICRREVEINRRTAPDLYLGVAAVVEAADGSWRLSEPDEAARPGERRVEPVVVMRRFDGEALFDRLAERGALGERDFDALAAAVAGAHAAAPRRRSVAGSARVAGVLEINRSGLQAGAPAVFGADAVRGLVAATAEQAGRLADRLDARARRGLVRRCHGDLHLRNVFRGEAGRPVLFDALEFDEDLATVDVAYDLAFLLMDLLHRGLAPGANRVWNGWLAATGDDEAAAVLPLFLSMRAAVRAHVGATAATQHGLDRERAGEAVRYLGEARRYLEEVPPVVMAVGGVSGTGKTTLARALAPSLGRPPGAVVLRSDVIRKRQFGAAEAERLPQAAYTDAASRRVFAEIHRRARRLAGLGSAVVADAVYGRPEDRRAIAAAARRAGVPFLGVWLDLPAREAQNRVAARRGDASDATPEVVSRQVETIRPPRDWLRLDAGLPVDDLAQAVLSVLRGR